MRQSRSIAFSPSFVEIRTSTGIWLCFSVHQVIGAVLCLLTIAFRGLVKNLGHGANFGHCGRDE